MLTHPTNHPPLPRQPALRRLASPLHDYRITLQSPAEVIPGIRERIQLFLQMRFPSFPSGC
jgi:hypothetical protein